MGQFYELSKCISYWWSCSSASVCCAPLVCICLYDRDTVPNVSVRHNSGRSGVAQQGIHDQDIDSSASRRSGLGIPDDQILCFGKKLSGVLQDPRNIEDLWTTTESPGILQLRHRPSDSCIIPGRQVYNQSHR